MDRSPTRSQRVPLEPAQQAQVVSLGRAQQALVELPAQRLEREEQLVRVPRQALGE